MLQAGKRQSCRLRLLNSASLELLSLHPKVTNDTRNHKADAVHFFVSLRGFCAFVLQPLAWGFSRDKISTKACFYC
jgi:hypothetical protein